MATPRRMGYYAALEFAALNGEPLADTYNYGTVKDDELKPQTQEQVLENAAGDIMVFTIASIFDKDAKSVARAIIKRQKEAS